MAAAIEALRPDAVVVELCRSRAGLLEERSGANPFGVSGDGAVRALTRSITLGGWAAWLLRLVLAGALEAWIETQLMSAPDNPIGGSRRRSARDSRAAAQIKLSLSRSHYQRAAGAEKL